MTKSRGIGRGKKPKGFIYKPRGPKNKVLPIKSIDPDRKIIESHKPFIWGYCRCGCGELIKSMSNGRCRRLAQYIAGHAAKIKTADSKHYTWIPERTRFKRTSIQRSKIDKDQINHEYDYYYTSLPDHPNKNTKGFVMNSRLVYEHYLKILFDEDIYIPRKYQIYHINKNADDNSLINLVPLTQPEITSITHLKDMSDRFCQMCLSPHTSLRKKNGRPNWYKYYDIGFVCNVCYNHYKKNKDGVRYSYTKVFNLRPTDNTSAPTERR